MKYDFASYMRLLLPVQLILLGIAALNRIVQLFETDSSVYNTVFISSTVLYVISIFVAIVLTFIISIVRFYQGMYSNEGYLSHTLPVTPTQHIFSKLLVSFLFYLGTFLAIFLSFEIATLGKMNIEIFKAFGYLFGKLTAETDGQFVLYFIEGILYLLVAVFSSTLMMYFCISIGQLAQKRKILLAFGVYFGLYVIRQILGTILIVIGTVVGFDFWQSITEWISEHTVAAIHLLLCGLIVIELLIGAVYFFVTRYIMSKKLNLA